MDAVIAPGFVWMAGILLWRASDCVIKINDKVWCVCEQLTNFFDFLITDFFTTFENDFDFISDFHFQLYQLQIFLLLFFEKIVKVTKVWLHNIDVMLHCLKLHTNNQLLCLIEEVLSIINAST